MATLYFAVWHGAVETAKGDPCQESKVAVDAVSPSTTQSDPIHGDGRRHRTVRLFADGDCFVTWGDNLAAKNDGTSGRPLSAGVAEYFDIEAGQTITAVDRT